MILDHEWSFRYEVYAATHQWRLIVLCCLAGSLLGWLLSWVWPSPYQASKELFVGLNISPSSNERSPIQNASMPVINANDYKNWQMASLNTVIFTDVVIGETLTRLRELDPYWNSVSQEQLTGMLRVYWRNAGKWRLVAEHPDPQHASDAVIIWENMVVDHVHEAVARSQQALEIDLQLQAASAALAETDARLAALNQYRDQIRGWQDRLAGSAQIEAIDEAGWASLQQMLESIDAVGTRFLLEQTFPTANRTAEDALAWLEQAGAALENEIHAEAAQRQAENEVFERLSTEYNQAVSTSMGLAPELVVQKLSNRKLRQSVVRPTGEAMLIGAALGWIVWLLIWLGRPARKAMV